MTPGDEDPNGVPPTMTIIEELRDLRKDALAYAGDDMYSGAVLLRDLATGIERAVVAIQNPHDEYHTMDELYDYRMLYNALAVNAWFRAGKYSVVKSWRHSDGERCFGGGWFIVTATLPEGQISNHYKAEHWGLFTVPAVQTAAEYDGHTPEVAAERMRAALRREAGGITR